MKRLLVAIACVALLVVGVALVAATSPLLAAPSGDDPGPAGAPPAGPADSFPPGTAIAAPVLLAEGWTTPVNVSDSPGPSGAPSMALDSAGAVHMAWYDNAPGNWEILYSSLPPAGDWSAPENVSANASYSLRPAVAVDHNDNVDVVWQDYGGPRIAWQGTLLFKAREPGQDFIPPQAISSTSGFGGFPEVRDPSLAIDSHNSIHLVWAGNTPAGYRIFYARKPQDGLWTFPLVINSVGAGGSFHPHLAVDSADALHVVWQDMAEGDTQYEILYSTAGADGVWSAPENLSLNASNSHEPWLLIGADQTLHVVWHDYVSGADQAEILYTSRHGAGAWSPAENVSHTAGDSAGPVLVEDASGTLHLVWYDNTPGNWEILYATKPLDGSWTSGANISQTSGRSGQPNLIYDVRGRLHLAWADDSPGDFDVFYTTKTVPVFSTSFKQASAVAVANESIRYTLLLKNASVSPVTLFVTDTLPAETTYVADSAQASAGTLVVDAGTLTWSGAVPARGNVTITFVATVNPGVAVNTDIRNRADVSDGAGASMSIEASTRVVLLRLLAPIILQAN